MVGIVFGLPIVWRSIVGDLHGSGARFVRADSKKTKPGFVQGDKIFSDPGTEWNITNPRGVLML
jgi:hypothetical protein